MATITHIDGGIEAGLQQASNEDFNKQTFKVGQLIDYRNIIALVLHVGRGLTVIDTVGDYLYIQSDVTGRARVIRQTGLVYNFKSKEQVKDDYHHGVFTACFKNQSPALQREPALFGASVTMKGKADKATEPVVFRMELPDFTAGIEPQLIAIVRAEQEYVRKEIENLYAGITTGCPSIVFGEAPSVSIAPGHFGAVVNFTGDPSVGLFPYGFTLQLPGIVSEAKGYRQQIRVVLKTMYENLDGENRATVIFSDEYPSEEPVDDQTGQDNTFAYAQEEY